MKSAATIVAACVISAGLFGSAVAQDKKADAAFIRKAKDNVESQMKDPASVQYRALYLASRTTPSGQELSLCGQLNSKNSYGGYEGFRRFISTSDGLAYFGDQIDALLPEYCSNKLREVR